MVELHQINSKNFHPGGFMKLGTIKFETFILPVIFSLFISVGFSQAQSSTENGQSNGEFWKKQTITAEITNVDKDINEITVKGPQGNELSFIVNENVDLSDVKKGDSIRAEYYQSILVDATKPTPEQEKQPVSVIETKKITPAGVDLAGGSLRQIKAVVKVKKIDESNQEVTLEGPNNKEYTISVPDKSKLDQLEEGKKAIVTYTEAFATTFVKTKQ
jgi:Cu/Ag efflux protein CusF